MNPVRTNILVIDDSPTVCKFISSALAKQDYQTIEAYNMESALDSMELIRPDLVITDILMPGIGGLAGISMLRGKWPNLGIIAMSAGTDSIDSKETLVAARRMGADAVMKKPFKAEALFEVVKNILESYGQNSERKRALIIDDSKTICMLLARELSDCGFICTTATSMEEALESEEIVGLDLVITDIFMPGIGGIGGIKIIRENWPNIKIVAISGGWDSSDGQDALSAATQIGADAVLKKPFDMAILGTTIDKVLAGR